MIPILLKIKGLYSYQDKDYQMIDFKKLTDAGLFGIFGQVGSGKSSVLEAIYLALFGQTERLNRNGDNYNYNMMNLQSKELSIEFTFENFEGKTYLFAYQSKRNSKRPEIVGSPLRSFYEIKNGLPQVIDMNTQSVEQIIGMSFDNFRRTIIIPQGKFQEFLHLQPAERTKMLKTIFHLERFDVKDKLNKLRKDNDEQLQYQKGALDIYTNKTPELLKEREYELAVFDEAFNNFKTDFHTNEIAFKELEKRKELYEKAKNAKEEYESLNMQLNNYNQQESALKEYKNATYYLKAPIEDLSNKKRDSSNYKIEIDRLSENIAQNNNKLDRFKNRQVEVNQQYKGLDEVRNLITELKILAEIKEGQEYILKQKYHLSKEQDTQNSINNKYIENQNLINKIQQQLNKIATELPDAKSLNDVDIWFVKQQELLQKTTPIKNQIEAEENKRQNILNWFSDQKLSPETYLDYSDKEILLIEDQLVQTNEQINKAHLQNSLHAYVRNINENEPCPLCGSVHHPQIIDVQDVTKQLESLTEQKNKLEYRHKNIIQLKTRTEEHSKTLAFIKTEFDRLNKELSDCNTAIQAHINSFSSNIYSVNDKELVLKNKKILLALTNEEKNLRQQKDKLQYQIDQQAETRHNADKLIAEINGAINQKENDVTNKKAKLISINYTDYEAATLTDIRNLIVEKETLIDKTIESYNKANEFITALQKEILRAEESLKHVQNQNNKLAQDIQQKEQEISRLLIQYHFENQKHVLSVLNNNINIEALESSINSFHFKLYSAKKLWENFERDPNIINFNDAEYQAKRAAFESQKVLLKEQEEKQISLNIALKGLKNDLSIKDSILKELKKVEERDSNLNILYNLIKNDQFVKYISTIYLEQLVQATNLRYEQLTNNQMSLTLSEDGQTFMVIDYLNGGKLRNVKTLSGGQTFQISLCIALALAESVQTVNRNGRNFSF